MGGWDLHINNQAGKNLISMTRGVILARQWRIFHLIHISRGCAANFTNHFHTNNVVYEIYVEHTVDLVDLREEAGAE